MKERERSKRGGKWKAEAERERESEDAEKLSSRWGANRAMGIHARGGQLSAVRRVWSCLPCRNISIHRTIHFSSLQPVGSTSYLLFRTS